MCWEEFDNLAVDFTKDNVETALTTAMQTCNYKMEVPKLMPTISEEINYKILNKKSNGKGKGSSNKHKKITNSVKDNDNDEDIPTTVIYKNVNDEQLKHELGDQSIQEKYRTLNNRNYDLAKEYEKRNFGDINVPFTKQNEYCIKMENSLNEDIIKASIPIQPKGKTKTPINIADENDDTLDLSPIHRTEHSFSENSVEINRRAQTDVDRHYEKESVVASVIPPLSNTNYKSNRKRKYNYKDTVPTENLSERQHTTYTKNRYSQSEITKKEKKPIHTFKDLFQYENFQDILKPINEEQESESTKQVIEERVNSRFTKTAPLKNRFYLPKDEESNIANSISKREFENIKVDEDNSNRLSKVRRYGKFKYSSPEKNPASSQISSTSTFDKRYDRTIEVGNELKENKNGEKQSKPIEPIFKNVSHREPKYRNTNQDEKMHIYEVDPMITEYGPDQVNTFRGKRTYRSCTGRESFRENEMDESPKKSLLKQGRPSFNSIISTGSAKKTVRFAESSEGLLRVVPIDPTFNESDFVYEMRDYIE